MHRNMFISEVSPHCCVQMQRIPMGPTHWSRANNNGVTAVGTAMLYHPKLTRLHTFTAHGCRRELTFYWQLDTCLEPFWNSSTPEWVMLTASRFPTWQGFRMAQYLELSWQQQLCNFRQKTSTVHILEIVMRPLHFEVSNLWPCRNDVFTWQGNSIIPVSGTSWVGAERIKLSISMIKDGNM